MRRTTCALLLSALVATGAPVGLAAAPVALAQEAPAPAPVPAEVVELPVSGVDPAAAPEDRALLTTEARRTVLLTSRTATADYGLVGVTWRPDPAVGVLEAWARTRTGGTWSDWTAMGGAAEEAPDDSTAEASTTRTGTAPLWVGRADGVQVRVDVVSGADPRELRVALVDPGESPADAVAAEPTAAARTTGMPEIRSRAQWGADESIRTGSPSYAGSVKAVVLHHTASSNDYAPADVPRLLRGFYAYHVKGNGWSDLGYNVVVDRFGTIWEGRAGGLDRAVIGSHAGGFNTGTAGISVIGDYETTPMSAAALESVAQVAAWKLAGQDPQGSVTITSGGGTKHPAGTAVTLPRVLGHRQVSSTSCPGTRGFTSLPALRERTAALAGGAAPTAGGLQAVLPSSTAAGAQAELVVRGGEPGAAVEVFFARRGEQAFTKRRDAVLSATGTYRTTFPVDDDWTVVASSGAKATPPQTVRRSPALTGEPAAPAPPLSVTGPVTAAAGSTAVVTATGPAGSAVSVWFRAEGDDEFVRRREGRFDAAGRFTTTYVADRAHDYLAMTSTVASDVASTGLGAVPDGLHVYAPGAVVPGRTVPVVVQGTPGAEVEVWFARRGEPAFTRRRTGVLGADGTYRTSYVATDDQVVFATSGARSSTREQTRVTTAPGELPPAPAPRVALTAPAAADAGSEVPVTVTGTAGAEVALWARRRGAAVWTRVREGAFDAQGRFTTAYAGVDDHELFAASGGATSKDAVQVVLPVLTGPASAPLGTRVQLAGRARPGDEVVLESRRRGQTAFVKASVTADATGAFRSTYAADDEYEHRAVVAGRVGALSRTRVAPTLTGPATAPRGSAVVLTGTARPGATVQVWFRRHDAPSTAVASRKARPLPAFRLGRTVTADAAGRYRTSFTAAGTHSWQARADEAASTPRSTAAK